jgi:hypothetical protein
MWSEKGIRTIETRVRSRKPSGLGKSTEGHHRRRERHPPLLKMTRGGRALSFAPKQSQQAMFPPQQDQWHQEGDGVAGRKRGEDSYHLSYCSGARG